MRSIAQLLWIAGVALMAAGPAAAQTIAARPAHATPGGELAAASTGLTAGLDYRVDLASADKTGVRYVLAEFTAAAAEDLRRVQVPQQAAPGAYALELVPLPRGVAVAASPVTVDPPLAVVLAPDSAAAGELVEVTVSGLRAGRLVLGYAGEVVLGPVATAAGTWSGSFRVPRDRPASRPAAVTLVASNYVGRTLAARGTASFKAEADRSAPAFQVAFSEPPPATVAAGGPITFSGRIADAQGRAPDGRVSFFWRSDDGAQMVPIDGGVQLDPQGNFTLAGGRGRAPNPWMDGVPRMGSGEIVTVVQGEQHAGLGTGEGRIAQDLALASGHKVSGAIEPPEPLIAFRVRVVGNDSPPDQPPQLTDLVGAYLEVVGEGAAGFADPASAAAPVTEWQMHLGQHQLSPEQERIRGELGIANVHGCPVTYASGFTNGDGYMDFAFDPKAVKGLQVLEATKAMGEIVTVDVGAPIPGVDVQQHGQLGAKATDTGPVTVVVRVSAGQQGYGSHGVGSSGELAGIPMYEDTFLAVEFDTQSGTVASADAAATHVGVGASVDGNEVTVRLPRLPMEGVVPYYLRVQGLTATAGTGGRARFRGMNSFPASAGWSPADVDVPNAGREMRFAWEAGFGALREARLVLFGPDRTHFVPFAQEGASECALAGRYDYVAQLPDLTGWPARRADQAPWCAHAVVLVETFGGRQAYTPFELCTQLPPDSIRAGQVVDRHIDALAMEYSGKIDIAPVERSSADPEMTQWDIPPQQNRAASTSDFVVMVGPTGAVTDDVVAETDHTIGNEAADVVDYSNGRFGFDDGGNPVRQTILDTGMIPLFRYPWGVSPLAGAVFGADLWMSATLAFYGYLDAFNENGNMVNATIDPTLNGGVNVFFDLDVLMGLVSASVSAQPQIGLSLKEKIGAGGLPGDRAGACFGFDLHVAMEVCAIACFEDRFRAFGVREEPGCDVHMKALGVGPGIGGIVQHPGFDLAPPPLLPSAQTTSQGGLTLVLEATADQRILAHHLALGSEEATLAIAAEALAVQHLDVEFLSADTALAVWSQSSLSRAAIEQGAGGSGPMQTFLDDLARAQVLYWSWFDGSGWSPPAKVPVAQAATGKPRIAANRCTVPGCVGPAPRAYLVWEHDANGNIAAPDIEVWGARFTPPASFATANRISGTGSTSDLHPDVTWMGSQPLVAWTSAPLPHNGSATGRRIRYRFVDFPLGGGISRRIQTPPLPGGAGWPTVERVDASTVVLAYTVAQDDTVAGNRQALHTARGTCGAESCSFESTEIRDRHGRQVRGERPRIAIDADGTATVQLRALAFGPDANGETVLPGDPDGTVLGTGETLAFQVTSFTGPQATVGIQAVSTDGLQHWRPEISFDPVLDGFITSSHVADLAEGKRMGGSLLRHPRPDPVVRTKALGQGGLRLGVLPAAPDLSIEHLESPAGWVEAGKPVAVSVSIRNLGAAFDPALHGAALVHAAWDAAGGAGIKALSPVALPALPSGGSVVLALEAEGPPGHSSDLRRTLFVEVRPAAATEEANGEDNLAHLTLGDMPVPTGLLAHVQPDSPAVLLDWEDSGDPRVAGYRVYRRAQNGRFVPYGSSTVPGYADLFAGFSNAEEYRVTSYSANGIESRPSAATLVIPQQASGLFRDGFELVQ